VDSIPEENGMLPQPGATAPTAPLSHGVASPPERDARPEASTAGRLGQGLKQAIVLDWRGARILPLGGALLCVTTFVVVAYYVNHPGVEQYPDSNGYIGVAMRVLSRGQLADAGRLPGYPLLMALVFLMSGRQDFALLSAVQGALFVAATLEVYALCLLVWRRTWIAFAIGLLVGTNLYLLKYVRPIISDGMALWVAVSLALASVVFVRTLRARDLWLVAGLTLLMFMTRPEWIYVPLPLFAVLLAVAARRGGLRRLLPHAILAVMALYLALGFYAYRNVVDTGYAGVTSVQNVNVLGKVMQYGMQDEAPPQYAQITHLVNAYLASGRTGPWGLVDATPLLQAQHHAVAAAYALAVIERHPIEFLGRSIPVLFTSSSPGYTQDDFRTISAIQPRGPFGPLLGVLDAVSIGIYASYIVFPLVAVFWLALLFLRRSQRGPSGDRVEAAAVVALLGLYALVITTLGGYGDYARIHTSFDPLMLVVIWGSLLTLISRGRSIARKQRAAVKAARVAS
jgi:hypothetical protein